MDEQQKKRSTFSGKLGFVLAAAGASVGLGNIWRFPYLAAKYGGGVFLLVYIILALTFAFSMIVAETALGRMTGKSPVGAFAAFGKTKWRSCGGWINAIIPILIVPYYSVIGGWVIKYLVGYLSGHGAQLAADGYFTSFISSGGSTEVCFVIFVYAGDHLCGCPQRHRAGLQNHDADPGDLIAGDHRLFRDAARRVGRRQILLGAEF